MEKFIVNEIWAKQALRETIKSLVNEPVPSIFGFMDSVTYHTFVDSETAVSHTQVFPCPLAIFQLADNLWLVRSQKI